MTGPVDYIINKWIELGQKNLPICTSYVQYSLSPMAIIKTFALLGLYKK